MDDNCGEWVDVWVWLVGVASGNEWNLWVWLMGVVVRRYIDFLILLIPTPLVFVLFCSQHPYFFVICFHFFSFLFQYFFVITFYVLNNIFTQYKRLHVRATTDVPQQPYEGCTYCFLHEEAHTNVRFISCDGHHLYEHGVDLEVEGVRYIEMHRGPAAYVLGPPPSRARGRDLELEKAESMHATSSTYTSPETPTCEVPSNGVVEISLLPVCTGETSI